MSSSSEYWRRREEEALKHRITDEKEFDKRIKEIYQNQLDAIQKEIESFYARYAAGENITLAEAKKRITQTDIRKYERKAKKYVADKTFSKRANAEMRIYNATMRINRLEMLKANIGLELIAGHDELEKFMGEVLKGRTEDELKRQAGILGKTIKNNAQLAESIVNASFHNATFSDRIWMYQDEMKADLAKLLQSGMVQGKNPRVLSRDLRKYVGGDKGGAVFKAERLMRTELARVQTDAQKQSFERNGFEQYEFLANSGCCPECQKKNGKHFKVKDMMPGKNAAPMHPGCRCSVAAYEDSAEYDAWVDYLGKGGTTAEWNASGKKEWENKLKGVGNSGKSDKIKSEVRDMLEKSDIEYKPVKKLEAKLSDSEIVKRLAGGDMTSGSCSSLGFAYIGNKNGLDVLDFRGGNSCSFFSRAGNIVKIAKIPGVNGVVLNDYNDISGATKLLKTLEAGKQYYLATGKHAAIVRKTEKGYEYLELQSGISNGFKPLKSATLKNRFGCQRSHTIAGTKYKASNVLIDVDAFKDNEEIREILGYINTAEVNQKKGASGGEK